LWVEIYSDIGAAYVGLKPDLQKPYADWWIDGLGLIPTSVPHASG
tara:strand:+ start:1519 stop:1653 length:135 start_codon:yes stop_codon:yes gene_type:complete